MKKKNFLNLIIAVIFIGNIACVDVLALSLDVDYKKYMGNGQSINVYNWGEFIYNGASGNESVNKQFEKLTGIKVNYSTFSSNEELYAKLRSSGARYDVIIPSDYMISRMINEDMIQKLDIRKIPNIRYIRDDFKNLEYDISNEYSVPYMWGMLGIIYNKKIIKKEVDSWNILWDKDYSGNILMFSNSRDAFSIALKRLGYSLNSTNEDEIIAAANEIKKQKSLVQAYVMDEIFNKMENEEALVAPYYAGDAVNMMKENSNLAFCYPKEGTNKFVDAMCIPKGSSKKELAYLYINFLTEPEIAAVNSTYIGYSTPNKEAAKLLSDEIRNNSIVYPSPEIIENTENYIHLPESINKLMDSQWTEIMSVNATHNKWLIPIFLVLGVTASVSINIIRNIKKRKDKML